jgi:hypothetical protein
MLTFAQAHLLRVTLTSLKVLAIPTQVLGVLGLLVIHAGRLTAIKARALGKQDVLGKSLVVAVQIIPINQRAKTKMIATAVIAHGTLRLAPVK